MQQDNERKQRDERFMREQTVMLLMSLAISLGLLVLFSVSEWGWLTR